MVIIGVCAFASIHMCEREKVSVYVCVFVCVLAWVLKKERNGVKLVRSSVKEHTCTSVCECLGIYQGFPARLVYLDSVSL